MPSWIARGRGHVGAVGGRCRAGPLGKLGSGGRAGVAEKGRGGASADWAGRRAGLLPFPARLPRAALPGRGAGRRRRDVRYCSPELARSLARSEDRSLPRPFGLGAALRVRPVQTRPRRALALRASGGGGGGGGGRRSRGGGGGGGGAVRWH